MFLQLKVKNNQKNRGIIKGVIKTACNVAFAMSLSGTFRESGRDTISGRDKINVTQVNSK